MRQGGATGRCPHSARARARVCVCVCEAKASDLSVVQGTRASHSRYALPIATGDVQERPVTIADGAVEWSPKIAPPIHLACQMQERQYPRHGLDRNRLTALRRGDRRPAPKVSTRVKHDPAFVRARTTRCQASERVLEDALAALAVRRLEQRPPVPVRAVVSRRLTRGIWRGKPPAPSHAVDGNEDRVVTARNVKSERALDLGTHLGHLGRRGPHGPSAYIRIELPKYREVAHGSVDD